MPTLLDQVAQQKTRKLYDEMARWLRHPFTRRVMEEAAHKRDVLRETALSHMMTEPNRAIAMKGQADVYADIACGRLAVNVYERQSVKIKRETKGDRRDGETTDHAVLRGAKTPDRRSGRA